MKIVYTTIDPKQVALIEMALRDAGVKFRRDSSNASLLGVGSPAVPGTVLVRDEDEMKAKRAIEDALQQMGEKPKRRKAQ